MSFIVPGLSPFKVVGCVYEQPILVSNWRALTISFVASHIATDSASVVDSDSKISVYCPTRLAIH